MADIQGGGRLMVFERPFLLLLLLIVPLHWWLRSRWREMEMKSLRTFVRPVLWDRVNIQPPPARIISRTLWTAGLTLAVIALAGPAWGRTGAVISTGGRNLVIALDVSRSMASHDEMPSRLSRASTEIRRLAAELDDVRIALVIFSGSPRLAVPITLDREFLSSHLPENPWDVTDVVPGTKLEDLTAVMVSALPEMDLEARLGVIFSDGGFHDYSVASAAEVALIKNMRLVTIGIGGPLEVPVPTMQGGVLLDGRDTVRTSLDESTLIELAEATGGAYMSLDGTGDIAGVIRSYLDHLSKENSELAAGGSTSARRFQLFLGAALILFCTAVILERRGI